MEEKRITLESIWTPKVANNVSDGQCSNAEIAVIYTYDFSGMYTYIHHSLISSLDCQMSRMCKLLAVKMICIFHHLDTASNLSIFGEA